LAAESGVARSGPAADTTVVRHAEGTGRGSAFIAWNGGVQAPDPLAQASELALDPAQRRQAEADAGQNRAAPCYHRAGDHQGPAPFENHDRNALDDRGGAAGDHRERDQNQHDRHQTPTVLER